jgi:hypothetical protein
VIKRALLAIVFILSFRSRLEFAILLLYGIYWAISLPYPQRRKK